MRQCRYTAPMMQGDVDDDVVLRLGALWTALTTAGPTALTDAAADDRLLDWVATAATRRDQCSLRPCAAGHPRR